MKRRDFAKTALQLVAAGFILPPLTRSERAWGRASASRLRIAGETEVLDGKILVIVNLSGGNDGLNTVVPTADPLYYAARPTLAIPPAEAVAIESGTGLHPALAPLAPLYQTGRLAVIQGVTYPDPNLSHFRSTDIWFSGSPSDDVLETGWIARFIEASFPSFPDVLPISPYGLQQAFASSLPFHGDRGQVGVVVDNPDTFYALVGQTYEGEWSDELPDTRGGDELEFVRTVDVGSFQYAQAIQTAAEAGTTTVAYPGTQLGAQLEIVARLISGQLDTPIYIASEFGFDTHIGQAPQHGNLMASLGQALAAFQADLDNQGLDQDVLVVTMSEFGRRVDENGGLGTDHGTAAPLMAMGAGVSGGMFGANPDLSDLDENGNLKMQHDFRSVFSTVLREHFGASDALVSSVMVGDFDPIGFLDGTVSAGSPAMPPRVSRFHGAVPNPISVSHTRRALLRFDLARPETVLVRIFDVRGRHVVSLGGRAFDAGRHRLIWEIGDLAPGHYVARLEYGREVETVKLSVMP